jgi:predicted NUDIX family phosphoesterase
MRSILVVARTQLFPGLSTQGFLPPGAVDLEVLRPHLFFAEREYMERCSHYKQIIPYLILTRAMGGAPRVLAYQRRSDHTEARLGGLWSIGFGGHIEPLDRSDPEVAAVGLVRAAALRELEEETGLRVAPEQLVPAGFINSDREAVSSVHFGVVFRVELDADAARGALHGAGVSAVDPAHIAGIPASDDEAIAAIVTAQAEPHRVLWIPLGDLPALIGPGRAPDGGTFEDWSRVAIEGGLGA